MFSNVLKKSLKTGLIFGVIGFLFVIFTAPSFLGIMYVTAGSFMVVIVWTIIGISLSIASSLLKGKYFLKNQPKIIELRKRSSLMWHLKYLVIIFACLLLGGLIFAPTVLFGHFIIITPALLTFTISYLITYGIVWLYTQFIKPAKEEEGDKYESNL